MPSSAIVRWRWNHSAAGYVLLILSNQGCASVGLPLYRLPVDYAGEPVFEPADPEPISHSLGLNTGQSDSAGFVLRAVRPGQASLTPWVSFKVHLGYPGPSYWSGSSAPAQTVTITP